jgi:glutamyl-tRNA synthetase
MAPSPTGPLHIGGARTTLSNWLFAKHLGGTFVLRIEDTDKERSKKEYEDDLLSGLLWLGLDWDEGPAPSKSQIANGKWQNYKGGFGPYRQSERTAIYRKYLEQLMASGHAYYCYCSKDDLEAQRQVQAAAGLPQRYNGHCRTDAGARSQEPGARKKPETIRFKIPEVTVEFKDMIRGTVKFDAALFGDIIIAKDLDTPLYNFAVVVDDALMKISHVIRGEEHIGNTPKQILMCRALGFKEPTFAHLPLILNPDRSKMSKRFGDTALSQYREKGYLPEAIVNFIALLGWHPKDDREVLSLDELAAEFDISRVQKAGAVFDQNKLDWLNREYLKRMSDEEIAKALQQFQESGGRNPADADAAVAGKQESGKNESVLLKIIAVERGRASTLRDFVEQAKEILVLPPFEKKQLISPLIWRDGRPELFPEIADILHHVLGIVQSTKSESFDQRTLREKMPLMIGDRHKGMVLWALRVAVSGREKSPDPFEIMGIIGKEESIRRIEAAIGKINR